MQWKNYIILKFYRMVKNLRERKVGQVLLAITIPLNKMDPFKKYSGSIEKYRNSLSELIESRKGDRYFFLPGTPFIDDLH